VTSTPIRTRLDDVVPEEHAIPPGTLGRASELDEQRRIAVVADAWKADSAVHARDY
jgi:hypothetical protein